MSDRSDEVTESRRETATDDLLEETDRLLSESDIDTGDGSSESVGTSPSESSDDTGLDLLTGFDRELDAEHEPTGPTDTASDTGSSGSWLSPLTARLSLGRYFSPKAYVALVALLGVGLLAGATVLPVAGRLIGTFLTAFFIGLVASKRRYLEMMAAGVSVGAIAAVLNNMILSVAGSGQTLVAIGATVGVLAAVGGYYFGRDLRDGLGRDLE
ncbi:DUF456 domain-containing protein [Haloterrigena sp. H1]|uniref:DUF456 domain-containing protein n=1 Tax=Haloterrigena sp. H1 TaxID=2552943 RepID=UPI00110D4EFB|nr:DUF456 domain-containing protein [Haloterrigena sp. H1]TMT85706.1 DUF456 domain-containing protein [Haloterrigena sp. H1]